MVVAVVVWDVVGVDTSQMFASDAPSVYCSAIAFKLAAAPWQSVSTYRKPPKAHTIFVATPNGPRNPTINAFSAAAAALHPIGTLGDSTPLKFLQTIVGT